MAQFKPMKASSAIAQLERLGVIKLYDDIKTEIYDINKAASLLINGKQVKRLTYDICMGEYTIENVDRTTSTIQACNDIEVEYKH